MTVALTTMTDGATEQASLTKPSSAVLLLLDYEQTSRAIWLATMLSAWHRNYFYSGGNLHGDAGGKVLSLTMLRAWRESLRFGYGECGHWRW
jgi:hypothetical protein